MELLYADDLVLETEELLLEKLKEWKNDMEIKGFRVNAGKSLFEFIKVWFIKYN